MKFLAWIKIAQYMYILNVLLAIVMLVSDQWCNSLPMDFDGVLRVVSVENAGDANYILKIGLYSAMDQYCNAESDTNRDGTDDGCDTASPLANYFKQMRDTFEAHTLGGAGQYDEVMAVFARFENGSIAAFSLGVLGVACEVACVILIGLLAWGKKWFTLTLPKYLIVVGLSATSFLFFFIQCVMYPRLFPSKQYVVQDPQGTPMSVDFSSAYQVGMCYRLSYGQTFISFVCFVILLAFCKKLWRHHQNARNGLTEGGPASAAQAVEAQEQVKNNVRARWQRLHDEVLVGPQSDEHLESANQAL
jgi:hypothetical protein